jgi:hypothetical protein
VGMMSRPIVPESDLLRAVLLARVMQDSRTKFAVTWDLTDNVAFLHERILRMVIDENSSLDEAARVRLLKILYEELNHQNESLFADEISTARRYLEYLRAMGADVGPYVTAVVGVEKALNAVMDKVKQAQAKGFTSLKEGMTTLHPIIKEANKAKDDLKRLRHSVDNNAEEVLRIHCRKIDVEAAESLFRVLTQEL